MDKSDSAAYMENAFATMMLDIVKEVLANPDHLEQVVERILKHVRELSGARMALILKHDGHSEISPTVLGLNPKREKGRLASEEFQYLFEYAANQDNRMVIHNIHEFSARLQGFQYPEFMPVAMAPVMLGRDRLGTLLALGLFENPHIDSTLDMLHMLSGIVALILKNAFLLNHQKETIQTLKETQEKLAGEHELLAWVIEGTRAGIWEWHVQTGKVFFNERWADILGYTLKEMEPVTIQTWIGLVHPDDLKVSNQLLEAHFSGKSPYYECECRMRHRDGSWVWIKDRGKVVRWSDEGAPLLMAGTHMDITERKQAEGALRESENRFRTLFETSPQALALTDVQTGRLLDANETLCRITGYEKPELIGKTTTELGFYSEKDRNRFIDELKTNGKVNGLEMDFRIRDGSIVNTRMFAVPIQIEKEALILTSFFDVTEQNRLEAEVRRSQRLEAIATLTGGIAHDYNNLLTVILGNIAFAKEMAASEETRLKSLQEAELASLKMRDLTHRLMSLSKGGMSMRAPGGIQGVLEKSVGETIEGSPVEVVLNVQEDLLPVDHDAHQLRYAIENVARNALEAMPDGGRVTVHAKNRVIPTGHNTATLPLKEGKYVQITIEDEGPGIAEAIMDRIFDPYFSTKQRGTQKGMGLGLPVAYAIIRNHGGQIDVRSSPGKGTAVSMILPAWEAEKPETKPVKKGPLPAGGTHEDSEKRVLVMDDEESLRILTEKMLERMGYDVATTADGTQAIDVYKQAMDQGKPFAAVILDLTNKEGMGGLDALRGLIEIDPGVKAIVSSGYFNDPVMADFKAYGFQAAIPKPYRLTDFERVVRDVMGSGKCERFP